jgi:hypothetical protein
MRAPPPISPLRPDVHGVTIGDDAVFLDVAHDRYLCVPQVAGLLVNGPACRVLGVADPRFAADLRSAGLLADEPAPFIAAAEIARPLSSAISETFARPRWRDGAAAARAMVDLAQGYWRQPLSSLVSWAAEGAGPGGDQPPSAPMLEVIASFHRWAPFAPAPGKCLLRSFMLLRLLRRHGHNARWVFGVRTWPFRAHCWLQAGDVVLDDDVEALVALTPILVV